MQFVIEYSETYRNQYLVEANTYEEAKIKLDKGIRNGEYNGPDCCVGSEYKEIRCFIQKENYN